MSRQNLTPSNSDEAQTTSNSAAANLLTSKQLRNVTGGVAYGGHASVSTQAGTLTATENKMPKGNGRDNRGITILDQDLDA